MFWYWIVCWFFAAFVALWIWHRLCRSNRPDAEAVRLTYPVYAVVPAPEPKTRRQVKYNHVPCPDCGKLRALTAGGEFHKRRHACVLIAYAGERLIEPEPKEAA